MPEPLGFYAFVDLLRIRLGRADAIKPPGEFHSFKELMSDHATPEQWHWEALEALELQGHLHDQSTILNGGDACARLSAKGRDHLRAIGEL